jgi:uncharacterized protein YdbL (DUF1318 family)
MVLPGMGQRVRLRSVCIAGLLVVSITLAHAQGRIGGPGDQASRSGYLVQVSADRSKDEVRAAIQALRARHPNIIGARGHIIRRISVRGGAWYRGFFGYFETASAAKEFCTALLTAGAHCSIQRDN